MAITDIDGLFDLSTRRRVKSYANSQLKLTCNHGFSFSDRSTEKNIVCEDLGNGTAEWTFLDSCYSGMNNNLIVNIENQMVK